MSRIAKRLEDLEAAAASTGKQHLVWCHASWDQDLVLDHYGRDRIGPHDKVVFVGWGGEPMPYPAGYFDADGRWAGLCAARGLLHRDH